MKNEQIRKMFEATNGRAFSVTFVKDDGSIRRMNGRLGVTRHLKGGRSTIEGKPNLLGCYDMQIPDGKGYRCIPLDRIISAKLDGVEMTFLNGEQAADLIQERKRIQAEKAATKKAKKHRG